jgi:H/ACA ribonucleoprotein complex subunit 2
MASTKPEKLEKKEKKRHDKDGVSKHEHKEKKEKKEKKKEKLKHAVNAALDEKLQADAAAAVDTAPAVTNIEVEDEETGKKVVKPVVGALVPFAKPLADDKAAKKVLKSVRKGGWSLADFITLSVGKRTRPRSHLLTIS